MTARAALQARQKRAAQAAASAAASSRGSKGKQAQPLFYAAHRLLRNLLATSVGGGGHDGPAPLPSSAGAAATLALVRPVPRGHSHPVKDARVLSRSVMMAAFARHETRRLASMARVRGVGEC
jgi:hypothetical protein